MVDMQQIFVGFLVFKIALIYGKKTVHDPVIEKLKFSYEFDASEFVSKKYNNIIRPRNIISFKNTIGRKNLNTKNVLKDGEVIQFNPGNTAPSFTIWGLDQKVVFPCLNCKNYSIIIHVFDPNSGFLESMWNTDSSLSPLADESINNTHFIFVPKTATLNETYGALWMKSRIKTVLNKFKGRLTKKGFLSLMDRMHFSVLPDSKLGNWIPSVLQQWECVDHLCGLDQVVIQTSSFKGTNYPVVLKRLDARFDWLPNPASIFGNKTVQMVVAEDGCNIYSAVNHSVAVVSSEGCSYFKKVLMMEKSGAVGVVVVASKGQTVQDMECKGTDCKTQLSIPATFVEYSDIFTQNGQMNITFQNTPTSNFFMAINRYGKLAEIGWFLYPSMNFLVWQAQWFDYEVNLNNKLNAAEKVVEIFKDKVMHGSQGVVVNVSLPGLKELQSFSKVELDMSLSCPGTKDTTCGHWDHTVNLYVCCDKKSPLCGMELGRWITSFRRRIGRWLTDISPLLPLFTTNICTFTMKTAPWAMPWIPSLNIRFSQPRSLDASYPAHISPLYFPGATFDKNYNSHFKPINFTVPDLITKVELFSVITGHGSDENGCGEFCVTSHFLNVNNVTNNITFSTAGTPFGCADLVKTGVEPNEHGTWLYGRNGWCDGRNVFPWVVDVTKQVKRSGFVNTIEYHGFFNGTDPNPKQNPGIIYIYSYLICYEKHL
ncbi:uncharacterized protein LOC143064328 [Mytilus galloprovincialis]|uniref:uncharacterized protein LOC143064328 n=1 Tax=Mytilus galloprovincialis TaxID=29158 RepID=UPI003F7C7487